MKKTFILQFSILIFLFYLSSCGSRTDVTSTSDTGSFAFSIGLDHSSYNKSSTIPGTIQSAPGEICADYGISTITANMLNSSNTSVSSGSWSCSSHQGTLNSIPAGSNYKITIQGKDSSNNVTWSGEQTSITINSNQTTNGGTVTLTYIGSDTTRPTVSSVSPFSNATDVPVTSTITVIFSESMAESTINTSSFTLKQGTNSVIGVVTYNSSTKTATFTPSSNFSYSTKYTATLTTGAKDMAGNTMLSEWTWSFTTEAAPTSVPSAPAGVTAAAGNKQVTISWSAASGATSYNIYWSATTGVTKTTGTKISNATSPYTHTGLSNGTTYYYVITAVNSLGESSESSQVSGSPIVGGNSYPELSNGYVSPASGTTVDTFEFYVSYYDADGDTPATRYIYIDGTVYIMDFSSGSFSNGAYRYKTTLGSGSHTYYFEFTDGKGGKSRLPASNSYDGPVVNTATVTVSGKILNNGQPVVNVYMSIRETLSWTMMAESYTDNSGAFSLSFTHNPNVTRYTVTYNWGDSYSGNTFAEIQYPFTSVKNLQTILPDFDIKYNDLFSPSDGATYNANEISDSNPIVFQWTNGGRNEIIQYNLKIWNTDTQGNVKWPPVWNKNPISSTSTLIISFNGILSDGTKITPGTYKWRRWCNFSANWDNSWNGASGFKTLIIK